MKRRQAIKNAALLFGGAISISSLGFLTQSCGPTQKTDDTILNDDHKTLLDEMADTLIPATDIPGAKAAGAGAFVVVMLNDCYPADERKTYMKNLLAVDEQANKQFGSTFIKLDAANRENVLKELEKNAPEFMRLTKRLVNTGYYTSEIGATKALNYVFVPGEYKACVPLEKGQKAWAM